MHVRKKLLSIVAVVGALSLVGAAQASAAVWSPAGSTFQGTTSGTGTSPSWNLGTFSNSCNFSTVELKTANPASADATAAGPTGIKFGNSAGAEGDCSGGLTTSVSTSGTWKFKANSTSSATITVPAGGLTVTKWIDPSHTFKVCDFTVNTASPISATWSNATRRLSLSQSNLPVTTTAYTSLLTECLAFGGGGSKGTMVLKAFSYQFPVGLQIS